MAIMMDSCDGIFLSLDSHKTVPAPFLTKTYQLVDDPDTDHVVSWGEDDTSFVVWRPPEFARDLLPNYFKHNNFSSFVRQLNTYGFRKIVPDRWEFANEFFKKGEKHLLCEIHRRKTSHPQVGGLSQYHHHQPHSSPFVVGGSGHHLTGPANSFAAFSNHLSISPSDSDSDNSPSPAGGMGGGPVPNLSISSNGGVAVGGYAGNCNSLAALSEDNERLRRSNTMLMSELAHMKKLYNDIIYFVQNHVKPVTPSNFYPAALHPSNTNAINPPPPPPSSKPLMSQLLGYHPSPPAPAKNAYPKPHVNYNNHNTNIPQARVLINSPPSSQSTLTIQDDKQQPSNTCNTKLFGVPLQSKKRLHPDDNHQQYLPFGSVSSNRHGIMEPTKARALCEKDELGLNLMPPSSTTC